ncbi:MAG: 30S ribosomal protein S8 [Pseudomonadota bacterium]
MSMQDTIADMLTRIRNAQKVRHATVDVYNSKINLAIATVLRAEGYIEDFSVCSNGSTRDILRLQLKYYRGAAVIRRIDRVSKAGLRCYVGAENLPQVMDGLGIAIITTSRGVMTEREARQLGVGGEVLCYVA